MGICGSGKGGVQYGGEQVCSVCILGSVLNKGVECCVGLAVILDRWKQAWGT